VGGGVNAFTNKKYVYYFLTLPDHALQNGLDILEDVIFNSVYEPDQIEKERKVILSEMELYKNVPYMRLDELSDAVVFRGTPFSVPVIGYKESVEKIDQAAIQKYVMTTYQPQSMVLSIAGNVCTAEVSKAAQQFFEKHSNTCMITWPDFMSWQTEPLESVSIGICLAILWIQLQESDIDW